MISEKVQKVFNEFDSNLILFLQMLHIISTRLSAVQMFLLAYCIGENSSLYTFTKNWRSLLHPVLDHISF